MKTPSARRNRGFTLIEVLLVLVILVVLASLAVVAYGPIQRRANVNAAKVQVGLFETALESYQLNLGTYPSSNAGLQALRTQPGDSWNRASGTARTCKGKSPWTPGAGPTITLAPACITRRPSTFGPRLPRARRSATGPRM